MSAGTAGTVPMPGTATRARGPGRDRNGGAPARRAMVRWAWRLFRREWRQQLLIVALITVSVGAVIVGGAIATTTPSSPTAAFGTAQDMGTLNTGPELAGQIAELRHRFGAVDLITNQRVPVPGSISSFDLRSENPNGTFDRSLLALMSGRYPANVGEVAVTAGVASAFRLHVGSAWTLEGVTRHVVGIVEDPTSLLDEFALVVPGQVTSPSAQATVLFDAHGRRLSSLGPQFVSAAEVAARSSNALNPDTIMYALSTIGMLLILLVSIGGFTVLAQRRLRALGMVGAIGATDRDIRRVVRANGVVTGLIGTVLGALIGFGVWAAYRPHVEQSAHHLIGLFQLPWLVIAFGMVLAVLATFFAAGRPARAITRMSVLSALSGRPGPLRQVRRSAVPGVVVLIVAFLLFALSGASGSGGGPKWLVLGLVCLIAAIVLLSPMFLALLGRIGVRAPVSMRLALRDLARYRARSGSALAAITIGILIAVIVSGAAAARYGNYLDYAGANLAPSQMMIYSPNPPPGGQCFAPKGSGGCQTKGLPSLAAQAARASAIARSVGAAGATELLQANVFINHNAPGRNWNGQIYVATPSLLHALGISQSEINPNADFVTMRPGISTLSQMRMNWGNGPSSGVSDNPVIQYLPALPSGTSAPNTLVTEHALAVTHQKPYVAAWLVQAPKPFMASQIYSARQSAASGKLTIETKSSTPTSSEVIDYATLFGIVLALVILAMSIGLIRSESAPDLRTLRATGASSFTHRTLTAVTAGSLGLAGAVLGTAAGYVALIGWFLSNAQNGGLGALSSAPVTQLLVILVGMPVAAAGAAWALAGREPSGLARQPIE